MSMSHLQPSLPSRVSTRDSLTRQRKFKGRSRRGCKNCRLRRVKCDEATPFCANCINTKRLCSGLEGLHPDGDTQANLLLAITLNPEWTRLERRKFDEYVQKMAPLLGEAQDQSLWSSSLPAVARSNAGIFSAVLAAVALHSIPSSTLMALRDSSAVGHTLGDYRSAIQWYSRSITTSIHGNSRLDIKVMLMGSVLYINNENRLGNDTDQLIKSTFAFIGESEAMSSLNDSATLAILFQLMRLLSYGYVDSAIVPREHKNTATMHALRIAAELGNSETVLLRLEFTSLTFDLAEIIAGKADTLLVANFDKRVCNWISRQRRQHGTAGEMFCLVPWQIYQVQWLCYQFGMHSSRILMEHWLVALLRKVEDIVHAVVQSGQEVVPLLELDIVPTCIFVAWYWRAETTWLRLQTALNRYPFLPDMVQQTLHCIKTLTQTDYEQATPMEMELFGDRPKIFQAWHAFRCSSYIALLTSKPFPTK